MLSIEEILAADDLETKKIKVPEWKGAVYVRSLTAAEQLAMFSQLKTVEDGAASETDKRRDKLAVFLAAFLCDVDGKPVATIDQAKQICGKRGRVVQRIVDAGHELNQSREADLDTIAKNSEPSPAPSLPSS